MDLKPSLDVIAHRLGQEMMLLNLRTNRFFELNRTGARLWELLAGGCTRTQLQETLAAEFDVEPAQLRREIDSLLAALESEKLVSVDVHA